MSTGLASVGCGGVKQELDLGNLKNLENPASLSFCRLETWRSLGTDGLKEDWEASSAVSTG